MASSAKPTPSVPAPCIKPTPVDVYVTIAEGSSSKHNELRVPGGVINFSGLLLGLKDSGMLDDPPVKIPLVSDGHFSMADVSAVFDFVELLKCKKPHVAQQRDAGVFPKEEIVLWVPDWTVKLLDEFPKDDIFRAINAAQYLQVPDFVHYAASYIAAEIRELGLTQLRAFLNIADDSGAPTLDRDTLRLIFRDALDRWSRVNSVVFIKRVIALNDRLTRDAMEGATKRFPTAVYDRKMELKGVNETVLANHNDFIVMLDAGVLSFTRLEVAYSGPKSSAALSSHSEMPSLRELKFSMPEQATRKLKRKWKTADHGYQLRLCQGAVQLMTAIIQSNVHNLRVLDQVPVWLFAEPLPALQLERYIYSVPSFASSKPLTNLTNCAIGVFEYYAPSRADLSDGLPLEFLADVRATEIRWRTCRFDKLQDPPAKRTNPHVQRIRFDVRPFARTLFFRVHDLEFSVPDIQALLRFFPSLTRIEINVTEKYRPWMVTAVNEKPWMQCALHQRFVSACTDRPVEVETVLYYENEGVEYRLASVNPSANDVPV